MKPIKTVFRLDQAPDDFGARAGIEEEMLFVPQKGLLIDVDGNLRKVQDVIYRPREHSAQVWLESYESDTGDRLQQLGWKGGYLP